MDERNAPGNAASRVAVTHERPSLGWAWELWCFGALWLACVGCAVWWMTADEQAASYASTIFMFVFAAALSLSGRLIGGWRVRRRRHTAKLATEPVDDEDAARRVLYLRSFSADKTASKLTGLVTEEEELEEALREVGEFTAVGEPGEALPDAGAARFYLPNERWEKVVSGLLPKVRLAVLRVGDTEGFWKEMRWAADTVRPERLVLLLPDDREAYETFRRKAETVLRRPLPEYGLARARVGSLNGLLYFEPDGTPRREYFAPRLLRGTAMHKESYKLKYALRPVYEQLRAKWTQPRLGGATWVLLGAAVGALFILGYALYMR